MSIKRYSLEGIMCEYESEDGHLCQYADHLAAVAKLAARVRELEEETAIQRESIHELIQSVKDREPTIWNYPADDTNRCAVCAWPLVMDSKDGCVRGNCSLRPRPERLYAPLRAEAEGG